MISERHVYVYIQLPGSLEAVTAAVLQLRTLPDGIHLGRFRYGNRYLDLTNALELDPFQLPRIAQTFEFTALNGIPGAVRDSAPDAWGRRVIEHALERSPDDLQELDYLLHGPHDGAGYLSFGLNPAPPPPKRRYNRTRHLEELIAAAQAIEAGKHIERSLLAQLDPGTSMGGARPKATIEDDGGLWLGKFPAKNDRYNQQRIEFASLELARQCGLNVSFAKLQQVGHEDVLMLKRFDRDKVNGGYLKFGMVSGLTILEADDSYTNRSRWSYPLLAERLRLWSCKPEADCLELFRRMVFNAAITNNDDHPRNHALLRGSKGWRLSPAYDLVPSPLLSQERRDLALAVGKYGRTASIHNLVSEATIFGLSQEQANAEIAKIVKVISGWQDIFFACGVSAKDITHIEPAMLPTCFFSKTPS